MRPEVTAFVLIPTPTPGIVCHLFYDSMISKLIAVAQTREEAIKKMQRALDEYIIEGIKTTIPFHQKLMKDEKFRAETSNEVHGYL